MTYTSTRALGSAALPQASIITVAGAALTNTEATAGVAAVLAVTAGYYHMVNSPKTDGTTVSLVGRNFGYGSGYTPSAALGLRACLTTSWSADTVLRCTSAPGSGSSSNGEGDNSFDDSSSATAAAAATATGSSISDSSMQQRRQASTGCGIHAAP